MDDSKALFRITRFDDCRILHTDIDLDIINSIHDAFYEGIALASRELGLTEPMPYCTIYVCPNRVEYDLLVKYLTATPTNPGRVGQPQGSELYLLSPTAYGVDALPSFLGHNGQYDQPMFHRLIVHECIHMVEEQVRPRGAMEVVPAYWSEGLAIFFSGQHVEQDLLERMKADLDGGGVPPLSGLSGAATYVWGWTLVKFLIDRDEPDSLARFSRESGETSLATFLQVPEEEFEKAWRTYAEEAAKDVIDRCLSS
jgi:hypothetical protein